MATIISNYKTPLNQDLSSLAATDSTFVTSNVMREFFNEPGYLDFSPSLAECEGKLKSIFQKGLETMDVHQKLQLPEVVRDPMRFDFSSIGPSIKASLLAIDDWLADNLMSMAAAHFFLHGFEHLFLEEKKLLEDEIVMLEKHKQFEPLKTEIASLMKDLRYVERLSDTLYVGVFKLDLREVKTSIVGKVTNCISDVFMHTIYTKFESMLAANKLTYEAIRAKLSQTIETIQNYTDTKTFVDSPELKDQTENISADIKLCRQINDFQTEYLVRTDALMLDYLMSLNWVKDLNYLQTDARRRLADSGPKFILELKRQSEDLLSDLSIVQQQIQKFPYYSDLIHSEHYYLKTLEINKQLFEMQTRGSEINKRQAVLESKETSFEAIDIEIKAFAKYSHLWEFISYRWTPNVERWWKGNFHDLNKFEMLNTINFGGELLKRLYDEFHESPKIQEIIKNKQTDVERHQNIYNHVNILKDPCFRERHWEAFFVEVKEQDQASVGLQGKIDLKKITLSELMEMHLISHTNFLKQALIKARAEAVIEQSIKETKDNIRKIGIKSRTFDMDNIGLSIVPNIGHLLATLNEHSSVCRSMLVNPEYPEEFKRELSNLVRLVSFTIEIMKLVQKVQSKLIKFSPLFKFRDLTSYFTNSEFVNTFLKVRQDFMEIMRGIFQKEMAYFVSLVGDEHDDSKPEELIRKLGELNKQCLDIMELLKQFFKVVRSKCPRYYFFSDDQMTMLCSLLKFPKSLFGLASNLFKGMRSVEITGVAESHEIESVFIESIKTKNGETMTFAKQPLIDLSSNARIPLISIISTLENAIKTYLNESRRDHLVAIARLNLNFGEVLRYARNHAILFQSLQLMVQLIFDYEMITLYKTASTPQNRINVFESLSNLKRAFAVSFQEFFDHPSRQFENNVHTPASLLYFDNFLMVMRRLEDTLNYLLQSEALEFSSFSFQSLPKYSVKFMPELGSAVQPHDVCGTIYEHTNSQQHSSYSTGVLSSGSSPVISQIYADPASVVTFNLMNYSLEYTNELLAQSSPIVLVPHYEKHLFHLVVSVARSGKNSQIRTLANFAGKNLYEFDCSMNRRLNQAASFVAGTVTGGFWLTFRNLDSCPNQLLSTISILVETVKHCVAEKVTIEHQHILPSPGYCIFGTYRLARAVKNSSFVNLPVSLLEIFRVITVSAPPVIGIVGVLVSSVLSSGSSLLWASKAFLHVKMCSKTDFNEDLSTEDSLRQQHRSAGGINLTLRVVCGLVRSALSKYFAHVQRLYEKFREPDSSKWRLDINKLKIVSDKDRLGVFTKMYVEALSDFLIKTEANKSDIKGATDLLEEIFKEELEPVAGLAVSPATSNQSRKAKSRLLEIIKEYKETNWSENLPHASKTLHRVEQYVNLMLELDEEGSGNHFLIYGKPDSQKSTIIKLLAFIYSEWYQINFRKFWVLLDAVRPDYLFGFEGFDGILTEIFNQCHGLDLEVKSSQPKKINYLFQANSELYNVLADQRDQKKLKIQKEVSRTYSWIVFDANTDRGSTSLTATIANILSMFSTLYEYKEINHFIGFSQNVKVFYELSSLGELDPKVISSLKMMYQESPLVDETERLGIWMNQLKLQDDFFHNVAGRVTQIVSGIALPFISKLVSLQSTLKPALFLINTSPLSMLNNFLALFEIFLNELRKYHTIHEFEVMKQHPAMISANKAELQAKSGASAYRPVRAFNNQMKLAQQAQSVNFIQARAGRQLQGGAAAAAQAQNYLTGIDTKENIEDWETRRLEALTIFGLVYSLSGMLYEAQLNLAHKHLEEVIFAYLKQHQIVKSSFACNYYGIFEQKRNAAPTDFYFDLPKGAWLKWTDSKTRALNEISSSFSQRTFSRMELERLQCQNHKLLAQTEIAESGATLETLVGLKEKNLVVTSEVNMLSYFLEYYVSYGRHLTVISEHQQGKSLILTSILRRIIEQNKIVTFNFQLQRGADPVVMQGLIEGSLLKEVGNLLKPPKKKTGVVWLDDVHMSASQGKIESLLRNLQVQGGWFSYGNKSFYKVIGTVFLLSMSVRESDTLASQEAVNSINLDILSKCTSIKLRRMRQEELSSVFAETVANQIVSTPTSSKQAEEGLTSTLFKQLVQMVYHNLDQIRIHTNYRMLNLNLDNFYQLAKSLNCISWKDVNRDKKAVQYVWMFVLRDFFACDLAFLIDEYRRTIEKFKETRSFIDIELGGNYPMTPSHLPNKSVLRRMGSKGWPDRRQSAQNMSPDKPKQADAVVMRARGGSMNVDEEHINKGPASKPSRFGPADKSKLAFQFKKAEMLDGLPKQFHSPIKPSKSQEYELNADKPKRGSLSDLKANSASDHEPEEDNNSPQSPNLNESQMNNQTLNKSDSDLTEPPEEEVRQSRIDVLLPDKLSRGDDASEDFGEDNKSSSGWSDAKSNKKQNLSPFGPKKSKFYQSKPQAAEVDDRLSPSRRHTIRRGSDGSVSGQLKAMTVRDAEEDDDKSISQSSSDASSEYIYKNPNSLSIPKERVKRGKNIMTEAGHTAGSVRLPDTSMISPFPKLKQKQRQDDSLDSSIDSIAGPNVLSPTSKLQQVAHKIITEDPLSFFTEFIQRIMSKGDPKLVSIDKLKHSVATNKKLLFDVAVQEADVNNEFERDYDLFQHSFEILDLKSTEQVASYLRQAVDSYTLNHPDAVFALQLNNRTFGQFLANFTRLHLAMRTEFQHAMVTTIKCSQYVSHMLGLICECLGDAFFTFDLLLDDSCSDAKPSAEVSQDTFKCIKLAIRDSFEKMLKNNKRLVIVVNVPSLERSEIRLAARKVFDFATALIFNTDMTLEFLSEEMHDFATHLKKHRISSHYEDFFATYLIRNKLESKVTFFFVHEASQDELFRHKIKQKATDHSSNVFRFLAENYPKLSSKLKKMVFNGLREPGRTETVKLYSTDSLRNEQAIESQVLLASMTLEMNYLKKFEKDLGGFYCVRPARENATLFRFIAAALHRKFAGKNGENDSETLVKEQRILVQRINRRKEMISFEITQLGQQIEAKLQEIQNLKDVKTKMQVSYQETQKRRDGFARRVGELKRDKDSLNGEEARYKTILDHLQETQAALLELKDKEFLANLSVGAFMHSQAFTLYAVIYHEFYSLACEPRLSVGDLERLNVTNISLARFGQYATNMVRILEDTVVFKQQVRDFNASSPAPTERLAALLKVIANTGNVHFAKLQADQRLFLFWIDLIVDTASVQRNRSGREAKILEIDNNLAILEQGIEQCDQVNSSFADLQTKESRMTIELEENIAQLRVTRTSREATIDTLSEFLEELLSAQALYLRTTSPFLAYNLDKTQTIEVLAAFILICSKYAYQTKRVMFYNLLKGLGIQSDLFNEVPVYDFLSSEPPFMSAINSKVPFNLNMLNNASIIQLLHDACMPFAVVQDASGLFVRWFEYKYSRFLCSDYLLPSEKTLEDIEACLVNGQPYLAVDPNEELLRLLKPIVDWRFRRFCETMMAAQGSNIQPTLEIMFNQKKIVVKDGFRILIVLQRVTLESFNPTVLSQMIFINNDFSEKKIWNETLTEELIIYMEQNLRNQYIQGFVDSNLNSKIFRCYQDLTDLLANFDVISDSLSSHSFDRITSLVKEVISLATRQTKRLEERKANLVTAREELEKRSAANSERDVEAEAFMNNHYAMSVPGYFQLYNKYNNLSDRLRVYYTAIDKFRVYVGDSLTITQENFVFLFKECIQTFKNELEIRKPAEATIDEQKSTKEIPSEQLEAVFNKIERTFYNQIMNSIPHHMRFIYTFLCTIAHTLTQPGINKRLYLKSVYLFLFSEKIVPKQNRLLSFATNKLYDRFNMVHQSLTQHFGYSSANLPENVDLSNEFDALMTEANNLETLKSTFRFDLFSYEGFLQHRKDRNLVLAMSALVGGNGKINRIDPSQSNISPGDSPVGKFEMMVSFTNKLNDPDFDDCNRCLTSDQEDKIEDTLIKQIQLMETKVNKDLDAGKSYEEDEDEDDDLSRGSGIELNKSKSKSIDKTDSKLESAKKIKLEHLKPLPTFQKRMMRQTSVELYVDPYGNVVDQADKPADSMIVANPDNKKTNLMKVLDTIDGAIEENSQEDLSPQNNFRTPLLAGRGFNSGDQSPTRSKKSVMTLISATRSIISRNKQAKTNYQRRFVDVFTLYLSKIMVVLTKSDNNLFQGIAFSRCLEFFSLGRSALINDTLKSVLPEAPLDQDKQASLGLVNMLTFFKYARPDLLGYILDNLYAEVRGSNYSRVFLDLGIFAKVDSFRRPIVLIYRTTNRSPFASLQRVADSMGMALRLLRIELHSRMEEIQRGLEELSKQPAWLVLENVELMTPQAAYVLIRSITNFLMRLRRDSKLKVWILYRDPSDSSLVDEVAWPDWIASCYRVHIESNKSIKEEMIGLYWHDVYRLSARTRSLFADGNVKQASVLVRGRSSLFVTDSMDGGGSNREIETVSPKYKRSPSKPLDSSYTDLFQLLSHDSLQNDEIKNFKSKYKLKMVYCLKFMLAIFRQRCNFLRGILAEREASISNLKNDEEYENLLESIFDDMTEYHEEPLMFVYDYLCRTLLDAQGLTSPYLSRIAVKIFMETYMARDLEGVLSLRIERELYLIPKSSSYTKFKEVFEEGILTLPAHDNPKIMGFRNNQEIEANYAWTEKSFKLLTNYFHETKMQDMDDRLLEKATSSDLQSVVRKTADELADSCTVGYLDYALMIMNKYEETTQFGHDSATILSSIISSFSPRLIEQMASALSEMAKPPGGGSSSPSRSNMAHAMMFKRSVEGGESVRSSDHKREESVSLQSENTNKGRVNYFKVKFRRSFLFHEFKTLRRIVEWLCLNLNLVKLYLCGEPVHRLKEVSKEVLSSFNHNEVPADWKRKLSTLNLSMESFSLLVRSLLLKFDQIYNIIVRLKGELPPIIPVNRLLDPQSFFINVMHVNCRLRKLNMINCVFTLRSCSDKLHPDSASRLKIAGLKVKGGTFDPVSGELIDENAREFDPSLGSLFLDISEAESVGQAFVNDDMHLAFVMQNQKRNNHLSMRGLFYRHLQKELMNPGTLRMKKTQDKPANEVQQEVKRQLIKQMSLELEAESEIYPVRIPVYFTHTAVSDELSAMSFFLYCYSSHPQIHWLNKGTHVRLSEF